MKTFTKVFTRKYTLLEDSLVNESLLKRNTAIKEIFYHETIVESTNGIVSIHIPKEDIERNKQSIRRAIAESPTYIDKKVEEGTLVIEKLSSVLKNFNIEDFSNKELTSVLIQIRDCFYNFGAFVDFTHHIEEMGEDFSAEEKKKLSDFHERRKEALEDFLAGLIKLTEKISQRFKMSSKNLGFLLFEEILNLVEGRRLDANEADALQDSRQKKYFYVLNDAEEKVFTDLKKCEKQIEKISVLDELGCDDELRGHSVVKSASVKGIVKIIAPGERVNDPTGKVIVASMTNPDCVTFLRTCTAIVTDEGGFLCHAANIARELKIPCIIGTKIATKVLKDGDMVEVDANLGIVRKL